MGREKQAVSQISLNYDVLSVVPAAARNKEHTPFSVPHRISSANEMERPGANGHGWGPELNSY